MKAVAAWLTGLALATAAVVTLLAASCRQDVELGVNPTFDAAAVEAGDAGAG